MKDSEGSVDYQYAAKLRDGSIHEYDDINDILQLENFGVRSITEISLSLRRSSTTALARTIDLEFKNGNLDPESWTSMKLAVIGDSRDWVSATAADLEDRIGRIKQISWQYVISRPWFFLIPLIVGISIIPFILVNLPIGVDTVDRLSELERFYSEGQISNGVEAIIFIERYSIENEQKPMVRIVTLVSSAFGVPIALVLLVALLAPKIFHPYVFYWGDQRDEVDKWRSVIKIIWVTLVLGVVASLIAGMMLQSCLSTS